jgi:hypothetical protein
MEKVLDIYKLPYNKEYPVVCMDESPKQLIKETRVPIPASAGRLERHDYEYERCGVCNVFMASEPLAGKRTVKITERKTKLEWANFIKEILGNYQNAKKIILIMDNLNTHSAGSLYEAFSAKEAKEIWDRFEFIYTPKHGSWLNMAEIELNVLTRQCLNGRIESITKARKMVEAWMKCRNNKNAKINWQFTTDDARIKLHRLYPTVEA